MVLVRTFYDMQEQIDINKCSCGKENQFKKCLWPMLHKDLLELQGDESYHGIPIEVYIFEESRTRKGTMTAVTNTELDKSAVLEKCKNLLASFVKELADSLYSSVYDANAKSFRGLLDLK